MPNFAIRVPGEPEPRGFQYDVAENTLTTDVEKEDPNSGRNALMTLKITEASAATDPQHELYWGATYTYRESYRLCEEEDISLEEAFDRVSMPAEKPPEQRHPPLTSESPPNGGPPASASGVDTTAAIVISSQRLLLKMALVMLDGYVTEDNPDADKLALLKAELEEIDGYEIHI